MDEGRADEAVELATAASRAVAASARWFPRARRDTLGLLQVGLVGWLISWFGGCFVGGLVAAAAVVRLMPRARLRAKQKGRAVVHT